MDLRVVKTRENIRRAFLTLRSKHALEKIKVTELCEVARINKTTFYRHYQDIFDLANEIEVETIRSIMNNFDGIDSLFSDPEHFVKSLYHAFMANEDLIQTLFSERMHVLVEKAERELKAHYALADNPQADITMSFLLWGTSQVLMDSNYDESTLLDTVAKIAEQVISGMKD